MKKKYFIILSPLVAFVLYMTLSSSSGGITGQSAVGCSCHCATASGNTIVSITGLPSGGYINGTVYPITVSVTNTVITASGGGFGLRDGFDLTVSTGSFTAVAGTQLSGATEILHNTPKPPVAGTSSWTFNWTAPASGSANVTFNAAGNATNGDGGSGGNCTDMWNKISTTIYKSGSVLAVTASASAITCNGGLSTITATGTGPTVPYQYKLNAGSFQSGTTFSSNLAGTYTITVKDATVNTATTIITISQPTLITANASASTINCNGGTSTITGSASGGTGAFTYKLNAGAFQSAGVTTFAGNLAGTYTVTARDANLCTKTSTVIISQPTAQVFATPSLTNPLCNGGTGNASVSASGGTGAKTYTISPLGPQSNTSGSFTGLTAQTYTVTSTDVNSCTKTTTIILTAPSLLVLNTPTFTAPLCNGGVGTASVTSSGGTGTRTYTISPLGPQSNTTGNFTGLTAQVYTITVTDANGCFVTASITITQPNPIVVTASNVSGCAGSQITLIGSPSGGTFSVPNPYVGNSTTYTYTFTNGNGCSTTSAPASITVNVCSSTLNLKLFLQGYYNGAGTMVSTLLNEGVGVSSSVTDTITVELRNENSPYNIVDSKKAVLNTDGTATCTFTSTGTYYIAVRHRNTVLTWSALPVTLTPVINYDFSNAVSKAYGGNMFEVESGKWAFYLGDLNDDENVDLLDLGLVETDISNFQFGYFSTDINGDGNVDLLDAPGLETNVNSFIFSSHP